MIELLCAFVFGMTWGYCFRPNSPEVNLQLSNRVSDLEKEILYYKDLCKWHVEQKDKK